MCIVGVMVLLTAWLSCMIDASEVQCVFFYSKVNGVVLCYSVLVNFLNTCLTVILRLSLCHKKNVVGCLYLLVLVYIFVYLSP